MEDKIIKNILEFADVIELDKIAKLVNRRWYNVSNEVKAERQRLLVQADTIPIYLRELSEKLPEKAVYFILDMPDYTGVGFKAFYNGVNLVKHHLETIILSEPGKIIDYF